MSYDVEAIRKDFPALDLEVNGKKLVYLDNAASALRTRPVIDAIVGYYTCQASNVHRGSYFLSDQATNLYENARRKIGEFVNARSANEIIFTRGTTESLNLVARSYAGSRLHRGDEIVLTEMEHHSNIVPWQMIAEERGLVIKVIPVTSVGELDLSDIDNIITKKTKLLSVTVCSNALGTINPIEKLVKKGKSVGAVVVLDAAQSVSFIKTDVQKWDCDFLAFSGHKMFGPNGIGVLYGKEELLNSMPPYQGGGSMINSVAFSKSTFLDSPQRFEAGTPNIGGAIGLGCAVDYILKLGFENIHTHEQEILQYATEQLTAVSGVKIIGLAKYKASILSFVLEDIHPMDVGSLLDQYGLAVRVGQHCTQPLMDSLGLKHGTIRASFSIYNTKQEVDSFVKSIDKVKGFF